MAAANKELCITIPTYFKCPISLEVMKSPVSLSTGVTYDRSSIQKWLDRGHTTCPATMQPLSVSDSDSCPSFVPNLTLHRLIHLWSLSHLPPPPASLLTTSASASALSLSLRNILDRVTNSPENRNSDDFVRLWNQFDPAYDHLQNLELVLLILDSIGAKTKTQIDNLNFDQKFVYVLRNGTAESKVAAARILAKISTDAKSKRLMIETPRLLSELYNLVTVTSADGSIEAGLSAMIGMARSRSRSVKLEFLRMGIVKRLTEILCDRGTAGEVVERVMEMLEVLSTVAEGRSAICEEERCVGEIVRRLMKVNEKVNEHGVTVVWSVCYLFPDTKAVAVAARGNGVGKCLLLLQSNCSGMVKQMCRDLVKVLRVDSKVGLASYDTKTIHIMPY